MIRDSARRMYGVSNCPILDVFEDREALLPAQIESSEATWFQLLKRFRWLVYDFNHNKEIIIISQDNLLFLYIKVCGYAMNL